MQRLLLEAMATNELSYLEDKIEELQQNEKFLLNNYDFHHKNNEGIIMEEEIEKLRQAGKKFSRIIGKMKNMRKLINEGQKMCDEVDKILIEMQIQNEEKTDEDDANKENEFISKKQLHVTFKEV